MSSVIDLSQEYRKQLLEREENAHRSMLKNYRSTWRGLENKIESTLTGLFKDSKIVDETMAPFLTELSAAKEGEEPQFDAAKLEKVSELLMKKDAWLNLEREIGIDFESVADMTASMTEEHRGKLGRTAVEHAVALMEAAMTGKKDAEKKPEDIEALKKRVTDTVEAEWRMKSDNLSNIFRRKALDIAENAQKALRREVLHGMLLAKAAPQIMARVKAAIEERENDESKDPALLRAMHSEYRMATLESYREASRLVYVLSDGVERWRWTSARTVKTCAMCWRMDGKIFPVETPLQSHYHCRCVPVPIVEGGRQITRSGGNDGEQAFRNLPAKEQKAILGMKAFEAYEKGEFELGDLIGIQFNQRFGVKFYRQSVDDAVKTAQQRAKGKTATTQARRTFIDGTANRTAQRQRAVRMQKNVEITENDGEARLKLKEIPVSVYLDTKQGFAKGAIRLYVDAKFILSKYPAGQRLNGYQIEALKMLGKQFLFSEAAQQKYLQKARLAYADGSAVTEERLVADLERLAKLPSGEDDDQVRYNSQSMRDLYVLDLEISGDTAGLRNLEFEKGRRALEEEFEKRRPKNNIIAEAFWDRARTNALKDYTSDFWNNVSDDLRSPDRADANSVADSISNFFRASIELHPIYSLLPRFVQDELVEVGLGAVNGAMQLGGALSGIGAFMGDGIFDLFVYGAQQVGLDKQLGGGFDRMVEQNYQQREARKAFVNKYSDLRTPGMEKEIRAYESMIRNGLPVAVWDQPNWSAALGNMSVQALPFIGLSIVTGGAGLLVQGAVLGTAAGGFSLGGTYISTNKYKDAMISGGIATVQGALGGVTGRLPFLGNLAADALTTYTFGKMQGQTDEAIFQQLVLQSGFAGAMKTKESASQYFSERSFAPGGRMNRELIDMLNRDLVKDNPGAKPITELSSAKAKETFFEVVGRETGRSSTRIAEQIRSKMQVDEVLNQKKRVETAPKTNQRKTLGQKPVRAVKIKEESVQLLKEFGANNKQVTLADAKTLRQKLNELFTAGKLSGKDVQPERVPELADLARHYIEAGVKNFTDFVRLIKADWKGRALTTAENEILYRQAHKDVTDGKKAANEPAEQVARITLDEDGINGVKRSEADAAEKLRLAEAEKAKKKTEAEAKKNAAKPKDAQKKTPVKIETKPDANAKPVDAPQKPSAENDQKPVAPTKETPAKKGEPTAEDDAKTFSNYREIEPFLNKRFDADALKAKGYRIGYSGDDVIIYRGKGGVAEKSAKLILDEKGNVIIDRNAAKRISKPWVMESNFKSRVTQIYNKKVKPAVLKSYINKIRENFQIHHIIADNVVRSTGLGKLAQRAGYSLDRPENLIGLVKNTELIGQKKAVRNVESDFLDYKTGHWTSHKDFDALVTKKMAEALEKLKKEFPNEKNVFDDPNLPVSDKMKRRINEEMKKIEDEFRQLIKDGKAPRRDDGSLSELLDGQRRDEEETTA